MSIEQIIAISGTAVTTIATVTLAFLTWKYVKFTRELVEETRNAKQPNVIVDFEVENDFLKVVISNNGSLPATDIKFEIVEDISWDKAHPYNGIGRVRAIHDGISYLAPGRLLKYFAGHLDTRNGTPGNPNRVVIGIEFKAVDSKRMFSRRYDIELQPYTHALEESFKGPEHEVAKAIESSERSRRSSESMGSIRSRFSSFGKKPCPTCFEQINPKAKKCPHCHEVVPQQNSGDASVS